MSDVADRDLREVDGGPEGLYVATDDALLALDRSDGRVRRDVSHDTLLGGPCRDDSGVVVLTNEHIVRY